MSLSSALSTAQSIFTNTGTQASVVAKNIANAENADYVRRSAVLSTGGNGAYVGKIDRAGNAPLLRQVIDSTSLASGQQTLLDGLSTIKNLMGGNSNEFAPATLIATFRNALDAYVAAPNETGLGLSVVARAGDLATGLNTAANGLQQIRKNADDAIKQDVDDLNALLARFETVNNQVKKAVGAGNDANDALDERDALVRQISGIVGVTSHTRDNHDMVLYTSDGVTLFETVPRKVTFQPTSGFDAETTGNGVYIDGVALKLGTGADTSARGSLQASLQLRDRVAPTFGRQLDEIARGLIDAFKESDPGGTLADATGLFTYTDRSGVQQSAIPAAGVAVAGLASRIRVNPAVVAPSGSADLLRDGGINGAAYVVNTDGGSSYGDLLDAYNQKLDAPLAFDPLTEIADANDLLSFASDSIGWLERLRSTATSASESKTALLTRLQESYSGTTGVSLEEELSLLLDIEQSYKAGAKLAATVDEMLQALMDIAS